MKGKPLIISGDPEHRGVVASSAHEANLSAWRVGVVEVGADIGLECKGCGHRVMLTRRELAKRMKANLTRRDEQQP